MRKRPGKRAKFSLGDSQGADARWAPRGSLRQALVAAQELPAPAGGSGGREDGRTDISDAAQDERESGRAPMSRRGEEKS